MEKLEHLIEELEAWLDNDLEFDTIGITIGDVAMVVYKLATRVLGGAKPSEIDNSWKADWLAGYSTQPVIDMAPAFAKLMSDIREELMAIENM